jgi:hypothetical protein
MNPAEVLSVPVPIITENIILPINGPPLALVAGFQGRVTRRENYSLDLMGFSLGCSKIWSILE